MKDNCFTEFCCFLSNLNMNLHRYIHLSPPSWTPFPSAAKLLQSCLTLCDPMDCSLPGSPVPGILQARTLEWVAISFSNAWKWKVKVKSLSRVWLLATPWTAAYQALPSMGFSGQQYWSGVPLPSPGDLPDSETDIMPSVLAGRFFTTEPPGNPIGLF